MSWAPLIGPDRQDSEYLRQTGHELLQSSFIDSLTAGIASDFTAPGSTASLLRFGQMQDALGNLSSPRSDRNLIDEVPPRRTPLSAEDWQGSADYRPGLSYFNGMTAEAAKLLAERHDAETARQDTMNRYHGGMFATGVQYAARFAAMIADPINIASAFVPVVGEMQAARLAAQLGRVGGRLATGAIEGAVGQALIEPLAQVTANAYQEDYGMLDSLTNVALGGLLGAGLHAGLGAIGDAIRPRTRTIVADTAIRQVVSGQSIDVAPVLRAAADEAPPRQPGFDAYKTEPDPIKANALYREQVKSQQEALQRIRRENGWTAGGGPAPADPRPGSFGDLKAAPPRSFKGMREDALKALEEAYPSRAIDLPSGKQITRKGPMDIVTFLRAIGGVQDQAGELRAFDAASYNKSREVQFAKGEQFLGRLVHDKGLPLEEAARRAADAGYIGKVEASAAVDGTPQVFRYGDPEELKQAIEQTLRAGDSIEGRAWGAEDSQPIEDYARTMREIDQAEFYHQPEPEHFEPLGSDDPNLGYDDGYSGADMAGEIDDPEVLWREELEREAAKAQPAEAGPAKPGEPKPLTPEQQVAELTQRIENGTKAAAACIAKALA